MNGNQNIKFIKGLGGRSTIIISCLITVISLSLSLYFINGHKNSLEAELDKRAEVLANNLAFLSQWPVYTYIEEELSTLIEGVINTEEVVYAYIVDESGIILAHSDTALKGYSRSKLLDLEKSNESLYSENIKLIRKYSTLIEYKTEKTSTTEEALFSLGSGGVVKIDTIGTVHLGVSTRLLNEDIAANRRQAFLITFVIVIAGIFLTVVATKFVTRPLRELAYATQVVAQGNLNHEVEIIRDDEIGILAQSFNGMIKDLKKSRAKIEDWNRALESKVIERTKELSMKNLELKKQSDDLHKALEELKTLDRSKDDFLALVSHELRTPLSSIVAYTEVLADDMAETKEDEKKYLGIIKSESDRLTRLITNVLDLSKMEAGRMQFYFKKVKLNELINDSVDSLTSLANKNDNKIINKLEDLPVFVNAGPDKIIQVFSNIISNAIKFSKPGGTITIDGKVNNITVEISIADNGIGIKDEDKNKVFDKFQQIENVDHHSEGTGLGMPISKLIIENHKGKIWMESEYEKGTTFFFTLPLADDKE